MATALYVLVAMLNSSLVQSYIGAAAGSYFSREWGGKVRIGAMDVNPFSHAVLHNIELISPTDDTIFVGRRLVCRFRRFPFSGEGLKMDRVVLESARYHLAVYGHAGEPPSLNLSYIIDYFGGGHVKKEKPVKPFKVEVGEVVLEGVDYVMDLPVSASPSSARQADSLAALAAPRGVSIPHMRYYDIRGRIRDVEVVGDSVRCSIKTFSTTEAGGMRVEDLAADIEVSRTKIAARDLRLATGSSVLMCDARLDYDGWESMSDYCHNVWHELTIKPGSRANVNESAWWAPVLWGVDCPVGIEGHCYGTIDNLHVDSIKADFGAESRFAVRGTIVGLPNIDTTRMDVTVEGLHATLADVAAVALPDRVHIEPILTRLRGLKYVDIDAALDGQPRDCRARLALGSGVGDLRAEASVAYDPLLGDYVWRGQLQSQALGVRDVLPSGEWLTRTGMDMAFSGRGTALERMDAGVEGSLTDMHVHGCALDKTTLHATLADGTAQLAASIDDPLLRCTLTGEMDLRRGSCEVDVALEEAQLTRLGLAGDGDSAIAVATQLTARMVGPSGGAGGLLMPWDGGVDSIQGFVKLKKTRCDIGSRRVLLDEALLTVGKSDGPKEVSLECDWFDVGLRGWFSYADFPYIIKDFAAKYLPGGTPAVPGGGSREPLWQGSSFGVKALWKDEKGTFSGLVPGCSIAKGTSVQGTWNYSESFKLVARSDEVRLGSLALRDIGVGTNPQGGAFAARLRVGGVEVSDTRLLQDVRADADLGGKISSLTLRWGNGQDSLSNSADLQFFLTEEDAAYRLMVTRPNLTLLGHPWRLTCPGGVLVTPGGPIDLPMVRLSSVGQSITAKAHFGDTAANYAQVQFGAFALNSVSDFIMASGQLDVDGVVTGTLDLRGIPEMPYLLADLSIEDLMVNGQSAGQVKIASSYESTEKRVLVDLTTEKRFPDRVTHPVGIQGSFLADGSSTMDLELTMQRISLQTAGPMIRGFSSNIDGLLSGRLHFGGTLDAPLVQGHAWVDGGLIHVDANGVTYYFDDTLRVSRDSLILDDFAVRDGAGNQALLGGSIVYRDKDLLMDIGLGTDGIVVFNNPDGDYYGRLLVSAQGHLGGKMQHPVIYVRAQTLDGSEMHIPVSSRKQINENNYVHFVSYDHPSARPSVRPAQASGNLDLQVDLTVTPGLRLLLPMDLAEITVDAEAVGAGDLRLTLEGAREPSVVGRYDFTTGRFTLSLLGLIEKTFAIEEGSSLLFPGNIQDARFDVKAVYNQRVNLATLTGAAATGSAAEYTQVQNVIAVAGTLADPSLKFDIRLPNADQSVVDQVNSLINLSSDRDMLNHTVSLLLLGRFASTGSGGQGEDLLSDGISSINVVAATMGSMVSNLVKVVDVDFKVQQGSATGSSQIDVGISKQWDKLYLESSFGYGSSATDENYDPEMAGVLVGDVMVGYKIKPNFSFYGFHRTNTSYYTRSEIPYKQGVGLKWTKEFDHLNELFRKETKR